MHSGLTKIDSGPQMYHGSLLHVAVCGGSADSMYQGYDIHMQSYKATPNRHPNYHTIYYKFLDHSQCVVYMRTGTSNVSVRMVHVLHIQIV